MAPWLEPRTPTGQIITLEPLVQEHFDVLREIARDESSWTYGPVNRDLDYDSFFQSSISANAVGTALVYVVRQRDDLSVVGCTRFMDIVASHKRVEIGTTWYVAEARGTGVNPEAKLLLLGYAFSRGANRVEFKTDARNVASRAALLKMGAKQEGVLRRHLINWDGFVRDSVYFSVLSEEWPEVRSGLEKRLAAFVT